MEKQSNKITRKIQLAVTTVFTLFTLTIFFSPYGKNNDFTYPLIAESVVIQVPVEDVFDYLGNSDNAEDWSAFVDHITTLNANEIPDGAKGSVRRCFVQEDEKEMQWDEKITAVIPNEKRQLSIYNLVNFPMTATGLATEQRYERLDEESCKLTFTVFFKDRIPTYMEQLKMYIGAYRIQPIFKLNMENIKRLLEKRKSIRKVRIKR